MLLINSCRCRLQLRICLTSQTPVKPWDTRCNTAGVCRVLAYKPSGSRNATGRIIKVNERRYGVVCAALAQAAAAAVRFPALGWANPP